MRREQDLGHYRIHCEALVEQWHSLLDYQDLNAWFDTNRCCLPLALSRMLDKRILRHETTI